MTLPVVFLTTGVQQATGRAKLVAVPPGTIVFCARLKPLKVTILLAPTAAVSKLALADGPATSVTEFGTVPEVAVLLNPDRVAVVPPLNVLSSTPGYTSMYCVNVAPVRIKLVE